MQLPGTGLEIHPLAGHDPAIESFDDLEPFGALVGDATVVGLGESWHTSGGFYLMKHRLLRYLVEHKGFRAFAIESDWQGVERTNDYAQSCTGTAAAAISESHPVWRSTEYAGLIRWICEWNAAHPDPADRVTVFGFDIQQPQRDGPALAAFMEQSGTDPSDSRIQGLRSCENAFGLTHRFGEIPPAVHSTCLGALDGIRDYLEENRSAIVEQHSSEVFEILMLRVIGLRAWQEQAFYIRDDFAKGFSHRDVGMAEAFRRVRALKAPEAKTVVWAADIHVAQNMPTGEVPLGRHLADLFGSGYVSFGITAYASDLDYGFRCGAAERKPGSFEERLMGYGHQTLLARPRAGVPQADVVPMGYYTFRPLADFDGVFFLAHSPAMHPLAWASCPQ